MKITTQLRGVALGILILGVGNAVSVYLNAIESDSTVLNQAGLVRGGTQRLVKLEILGHPNDNLIQKLNQKINGLIHGDQDLGLPPTKDPELLSQLMQVENSWNILKKTISKVRKNPESRNELLNQSEDYFKLTDETVLAAEKYSQTKVRYLRSIQLTILGLTIVMLVIIFLIANRITSTLQSSINVIATSSTRIASTVAEQERTISLQASTVSQTTAIMDELGASSVQSAEHAQSSAVSAYQTLSLTRDGAREVEQTTVAMLTLKDKVQAIAQQILYLSKQTEQIKEIANLVNDVALQTNILAINTAVEAARVGEQAEGFGIVAAEVRKLADKNIHSAEKINHLVAEIQTAMNSAVSVTDEGVQTALEGIKLSQGTAQTFVGVTDAINNVFLNSQQISLNAKQQSIAVQQVVEIMNTINHSAQENATGIANTRLSTEQLNKAAQNLQVIV
jgi:methyl-accepting chemotaxis protein